MRIYAMAIICVYAMVFSVTICLADEFINSGGQLVELHIDSSKCLILPQVNLAEGVDSPRIPPIAEVIQIITRLRAPDNFIVCSLNFVSGYHRFLDSLNHSRVVAMALPFYFVDDSIPYLVGRTFWASLRHIRIRRLYTAC